MMEILGAFGVIISIIWILLIITFFIASIAFWVWMLIDAIRNQKEDKIPWILLLFSINILGAIIYFLVARKERKK